MAITDIHNPWRDSLLPASYRGAAFHCELGSWEGGRRIVVHEFPKKDLPYSEDMGRRAIEFNVRGYCVAYPVDTGFPLYQRDYRIARDLLREQLDQGEPGRLQLPTLNPLMVVCPRYRMSEEDKLGGFVMFDMTFVEYGAPVPAEGESDPRAALINKSEQLRENVVRVLG